MMVQAHVVLWLLLAAAIPWQAAFAAVTYFDVPSGSHPHDVAAVAVPDGPVYFTAQSTGKLGRLDPRTGQVEEIALGEHSAPHGVIIGRDGGVWITDGGEDAIVRFDATTRKLQRWPLPQEARHANLNTLTMDARGRVWFTGQSGYYGRLDPKSGSMRVWKSSKGPGPYGICATPLGQVFYASLAGNYIAHIDTETGVATVIEPPTSKQGARRIWPDSAGRLWVSYWNTGQVGRFDPTDGTWREWKLPGAAHVYAVWVDNQNVVWLTDWSTNAIVRFDPKTETFRSFPSNQAASQVRQLGGRAGEVWAPESGTDRLVRITGD